MRKRTSKVERPTLKVESRIFHLAFNVQSSMFDVRRSYCLSPPHPVTKSPPHLPFPDPHFTLAHIPFAGTLIFMPPSGPAKSLQEVVQAVGVYPAEAYLFVQQGLTYTVQKIHAEQTDPNASRHVSGRDLCEGLRELALKQWGLMARTVLARWNITSTMDFGRIVFAMVEHDLLQKTENDRVEDFRKVYDFTTAFEKDYRIEATMENARARPKETKL